jgi:glutamate-1-semialdehyde aminotransferase
MKILPHKIWQKAKKIIPGGNGLLSKRPERFSNSFWPTFFSKARGIDIWDLNKKKFIDMSIMGIGTSTLGYKNNVIDKKVKSAIDKSVNTTLNSLDEYLLAKKILKYDKFANQVKFARTGGEAMSIAIRIARAKNKYSKIAFSGYHGWQDWYIAANLDDSKNLNNHLLKNLIPLGVPKELKGTIIPFKFNDFEQVENLSKKNELSAIVIECGRYDYLSKNFIKKINSLCIKKNVCLIVDEVTTGWRENNGGLYKQLGIKPDIVVYGKSLGNGYAISAIVGKEKYMKFANKTFVSSTAWTESIGFNAGLAVIDFFVKNNVSKHLVKVGILLKKGWVESAKKNNIKLEISNIKTIPSFQFRYGINNEKIYTYFTDEMLKEGYLASSSVYLSYKHKKKDIRKYLISVDKVFKKIALIIKDKKNLNKIKTRKFKY